MIVTVLDENEPVFFFYHNVPFKNENADFESYLKEAIFKWPCYSYVPIWTKCEFIVKLMYWVII